METAVVNIKRREEQEDRAAAGIIKRRGEQENISAAGNIKRREEQRIEQQQGI